MSKEEKFVNIGGDEETYVPKDAVEEITTLAKFCHGVIAQFSQAYGQDLKAWEALIHGEQQHYIGRVAHFMTYPDSTAGGPHEAWKMRLMLNGWSHGSVFDSERKTRPELVYFSQLAPEQQAVDFIIKGIVDEMFNQFI